MSQPPENSLIRAPLRGPTGVKSTGTTRRGKLVSTSKNHVLQLPTNAASRYGPTPSYPAQQAGYSGTGMEFLLVQR